MGKIISEERGKTDFGYDCIFLSNDLNKTFGEATEEEKNSVSHRKRALNKLLYSKETIKFLFLLNNLKNILFFIDKYNN